MKVYKGTDMNMKCRGKQYALGETVTEDQSVLCNAGLHACEMPIDVLQYYFPNNSRYFVAEAEDVSEQREEDSKIVAKKMTLKAELGIAGLVKAQIDFVKEQNKFDDAIAKADKSKKNRATGERGAASATGESGAASATGSRGAASATGESGAASATGFMGAASATGDAGIAVAAGYKCKAKGAIGCAICCVERGGWNGRTNQIIDVKAAIVDGYTIKENTWYELVNGEFVEVKE